MDEIVNLVRDIGNDTRERESSILVMGDMSFGDEETGAGTSSPVAEKRGKRGSGKGGNSSEGLRGSSGISRKGQSAPAGLAQTGAKVSGKSRQAAVGEKLRKINQERLKAEMKQLKDKNEEISRMLKGSELQLQEESLKRRKAVGRLILQERKFEELKQQRLNDNTWLKFVYRDLPPDVAKEFKKAVVNNRNHFQPGTVTRLRKATGVNFSQVPVPKTLQQTEREAAVKEFAILNSSEIPDMKANKSEISSKKTPNKRFALHYLTVLHDQFNLDYPHLQCSYSTFSRIWPNFIIKPGPGDFSSCHCTTCENNSLLMASLLKLNLAEESQDVFIAIKMFEEGDAETWEELLKTLENIELCDRKDELVTYVQWEMVVKEVLEDEDNYNKENGKK